MRTARLLSIAVGLFVSTAGCVGPTASTQGDLPDDVDVDGVESAASADERADGQYTVPVDASLAHVATNPVSVKLMALGGNRFRLNYDLPTVLAGVDKDVDLTGTRGTDATWTLSGAAGTAECTEVAGEVRCNEVLAGVAVNLTEVSAALAAANISAAERAARLEVASKFKQDPLGILTFRRPGSGSGRGRGR